MGFDFSKYNRIILVGNSGSGKSWLAKRIAERTGYPRYHLDKEFCLPDGAMPPRKERIAIQSRIMAGKQWIIEGNYNSTMEARFAASDLVIFLDMNRVVCVISAMRRTGKQRSDYPDYLKEPKAFSRDDFEFCKWIWFYAKTRRKTVVDLHEKYADKMFLHIKSRRELKRIL